MTARVLSLFLLRDKKSDDSYAPAAPSPTDALQQMRRAWKLRQAKRYIWIRGLVPYWDRDQNTRFRQR
jgi:hypothetical protein